uniref:Ig-like domain-containing protein n=1 Tax=Oryzias melastigma TaxID=30732 RepID=A0A3B3CFS9_ORYME
MYLNLSYVSVGFELAFVSFLGQKTYPKSSSSVEEKDGFLSVNIGESVSLECSYEDHQITWIACTDVTFFDEFKNNERFKLDTENRNYHLKIFNLQLSDSATYYCAVSLTVKASVDQSSSENIHAGDSVTLNCTVHTGSCDGEHRVYWFKDSEDSHPGLIYTDGGRKDHCESKKNTQTHTCNYELLMKNLNESHSGIYYCRLHLCLILPLHSTLTCEQQPKIL